MNSGHKKARVGARAIEVFQMTLQSVLGLKSTGNGQRSADVRAQSPAETPKAATTSVVPASAVPLLHVLKEGRFKVSATLAMRVLEELHFSGQRPVRPHRVEILKDIIRRKQWTPSQIAFARLAGRLYLMNGQHRLTALVETGGSIEVQILIVEVENEDQLRALYHHFDVAVGVRSKAEILNSIGIADSYGLTKTGARAVYDAVALITNRFEPPNYQKDPVKARSVDRRLEAAQSWWPVMAKFEKLIVEAPPKVRKKLYAQGSAAVALVTLRYQPELAAQFWSGLAGNDGLAKGDPRNTLLVDMMTRQMNVGIITQAAITSANAWNAWVAKKRITHLKVLATSKVRIAGTPFDGRRE